MTFELTPAELNTSCGPDDARLAYDLAERRGEAALADWARTYGRPAIIALELSHGVIDHLEHEARFRNP